MTSVVLVLLLLASVPACLWRLLRGPSAADRLVAVQLFGTAAVAMLLVLAEAVSMPAARDVALVFALLAVLTAAAFVSRSRAQGDRR